MSAKPGRESQVPGAMELLDEAAHLLRARPAAFLFSYAAGTLPFVLGLLYFWGDMSTNAFGAEHLTASAFAMAALFVWMKVWHTRFSLLLHETASGIPMGPMSLGRWWKITATQTFLHATSLFVLPVAFLITLPAGYCVAFYHNVSLLGDGREESLFSVAEEAWAQARLWPGQNHTALLWLALFSVPVLINIAAALAGAPHMAKMFLGLDSAFTLAGPRSILNTTWLAAVCALSWTVMTPLVKAFYVLRCYHGKSLRTGADLSRALKRIAVKKSVAACALLALLAGAALSPGLCRAAETLSPPSGKEASVPPEELSKSLDQVLSERAFTWRVPQEEKPVAEQGAIASFIGWIAEQLGDALKYLGERIARLYNWIRKLFPKRNPQDNEESAGLSPETLRILALIILALSALGLLWLGVRALRARRAKPALVPVPVPPAPDLMDEKTTAADLPAGEWLTLARELLARGAALEALRAFYFATLASLADARLVTITQYKTNGEYAGEVRRRGHAIPELPGEFARHVQAFDRAWYGKHAVEMDEARSFALQHERISALALR
jgi:hypothetical protein